MTGVPPHSNDAAAGRRMVSLRLSPEARAILKRLSHNWGISQSAVLEVLLREAVAPTNRR